MISIVFNFHATRCHAGYSCQTRLQIRETGVCGSVLYITIVGNGEKIATASR